MTQVVLLENNCCGTGFGNLLHLLKGRFGDEVNIEVLNLARMDESTIIPKEIREKIATDGISFLPAIFVDGALVSYGAMPNLMDAIELIQNRRT